MEDTCPSEAGKGQSVLVLTGRGKPEQDLLDRRGHYGTGDEASETPDHCHLPAQALRARLYALQGECLPSRQIARGSHILYR